jgi:hypothetical protein
VDRTAPANVALPQAKGGIQAVSLTDIVHEVHPTEAPNPPEDPSTAPTPDTPAQDAAENTVTVTTQAVRTEPFTVAGLTWAEGDEPDSVRMRTFADGAWTAWQDVEIASRASGPAPGSPEARSALGGTEPFVAMGSSGVQFEVVAAGEEVPASLAAQLVDGAAPGGAVVAAHVSAPFGQSAGSLVRALAAAEAQPGVPPGDDTGPVIPWAPTEEPTPPGPPDPPTEQPTPPPDQPTTPPDEPTTPPDQPSAPPPTPVDPPVVSPEPPPAPPQPPITLPETPAEPVIHSRAEWGANEARVKKNPSYFSTFRGVVVHHTAGSNTYTPEQVPDVINAIFNYHVGSLKWNDIGYNFLVDKYGGIWEGRAGGITANVVGAHANHFNSETAGVSLLGNYDEVEPTAEAIAALSSIIGWRLAQGGISNPAGTSVYSTNGKEMSVVIGHKDAVYWRGGTMYNATACPGQYLYPYLEVLRTGAVYPVVGRPDIAGPTDVTPGEIATFSVSWGSASGPVSGLVEVQRYVGSQWTPLAQVSVVDGLGLWQVRPSGNYTYRAVGVAVTNPAGWRLPAKTTSASVVTTRAISRGATRTPRLLLPAYAPVGKVTTAVALWKNPYKAKPHRLEVQVRKNGKWVRLKTITVKGLRTFKIRVEKSANYRLKVSAKSAPKRATLRVSKTAKMRAWQ